MSQNLHSMLLVLLENSLLPSLAVGGLKSRPEPAVTHVGEAKKVAHHRAVAHQPKFTAILHSEKLTITEAATGRVK